LRYSEEALSVVAENVCVLAESEGLAAHARSAMLRKASLTQSRKGAKEIGR